MSEEDLLGDTLGNPNEESIEFVYEEPADLQCAGQITTGSRTEKDIHTSHLTIDYRCGDGNGNAKGNNTGGNGHGESMEHEVAPAETAGGPETVFEYAAAPGSKGVESDGKRLYAEIRAARLKGYEGDMCGECGQFTMVRNGTCLKCDTCGATSGCS